MSRTQTLGGTAAQRYDRFSRLVQDEIGVRLPHTKQIMVESRLRRRMNQLQLGTVDDYFHYLFDENALDDELGTIFDAVTTNKTDFFREPDHFTRLASDILPARLKRRKATGTASMFKIWSAASSTGMEAFTLAMILAEHEARTEPFDWGILGTDINLRVLERAFTAIYTDAEIAPVPPLFRDRYLMRGNGQRAGEWRVTPTLRRRVRFEQLNLMDNGFPVDTDLDAIFLRNVLIYFDDGDQERVIDKMTGHLAPKGHLFVGHSESMTVHHPALTQIAPAVFCKS